MMTYDYLMNNLGCAEDGYKALYHEVTGDDYTGNPVTLKDSMDWCLAGLIDWEYLNKNAKRINQSGVSEKDQEILDAPYREMLYLRYGLDGKIIRDFADLADHVHVSMCWRYRTCTPQKAQGWVMRGIKLLRHPMYVSVLRHGALSHFINTLCPSIENNIDDMVTSVFEVTYHEELPEPRGTYHRQPLANEAIMMHRSDRYNDSLDCDIARIKRLGII